MSKVSAIRPEVVAEVSGVNPHGSVWAWTFIDVQDIFGNQRCRRVGLGYTSCDLEYARKLIENARKDNFGRSIEAKFEIFL